MDKKILYTAFFNRPTPKVARDLLGKFLVRRVNRKIIAKMITEVEAYDGLNDKASHAHRGKTKRNFPMFGGAGHWYVYFTYGMYWMLNIVTGEKGYPAAVLIRGVHGISGPGRLTKELGIDKKYNALTAAKGSGLWIEDRGIKNDGKYVHPSSHKATKDDFQQKLKIKKGPRIGIDYAGPYWAKRHWRFWVAVT